MRFVFLSTFYPFRGGIAQFNALVYRELEKNNEVVAVTFKRQYPKLLFPGKTQYVTPEDTADKIPSFPWLDTINPFSYVSTAKKVRNLRPEVVITKYWMTFFGPSLGFVLSRQSRFAKRIAILDNVIPHERRFFDHAFNRYFLNRNDGFIAMTEKVKNDLLYYIPDAKCMLIPHPIYNHFGARLAREEALRNLNITVKEDSRVLLFFGIIRDYKGLDVLIEALSLLDNRYVLIIAGEAYGDFKKYEKCMERFEVKERCFVFERYIGDEEVPNFFSAGDVCVLPYKSATQSGITGIAQHFELPVIATKVGGLAETIAHNQTGLIVDHVDPAELASQIGFYFDNQCRESFAVNIQNQNKENNWGSFVKKLEAFVQEI